MHSTLFGQKGNTALLFYVKSIVVLGRFKECIDPLISIWN